MSAHVAAWIEYVLGTLPLACAAYIAVSSGQLMAFMGIFVLTGALVGAGMPWGVAVLVAGPTGFVLGWASALPMQRLRGLDYALVGVCLAEIARLFFASSALAMRGLGYQSPDPLRMSERSLTLAVSVVSLVVVHRYSVSALSRSLSLSHRSEASAEGSGIHTGRLRTIAAGLAGMLAALGGVLHLRKVGIVEPSVLGFEFGILALAPVFVGGTRHWGATVVAAIFLAAVTRGLQLPNDWRGVAIGGVVVAATVVRRLVRRRGDYARTVPKRDEW